MLGKMNQTQYEWVHMSHLSKHVDISEIAHDANKHTVYKPKSENVKAIDLRIRVKK
jgi:hypothetical protein